MNILGWSPEQTPSLELYHPQPIAPATTHSRSQSSTPTSNRTISLDPTTQSPSLTPRSSSIAPSESSRPQTPPRRGDPDWVPRPRNCFFIFRGEYIKLHSRGGKEAPLSGSDQGLGLSKRAGQAWKKLSPKEKAEYERMADEERIRHARDHPNYRYRPTRSDSDRRKSDTRARRLGPRPSTRHPRGTLRAQTESPLTPSHLPDSRSNTPFGILQLPSTSSSSLHPEELVASRRRSLSVPPLFTFQHYPHPHFGEVMPHELRRAVSNQESAIPMPGTPSHISFIDSQEMTGVATPAARTPIPGHPFPSGHPEGNNTFNVPAPYASPFAAVSSSLANWNGSNFHYPPPLHQSWSAASFFSEAGDGSSQIGSPSYVPPAVGTGTGIEYRIPVPVPVNAAITHEFPHFGSTEHSAHDTARYANADEGALENFEIGLIESGGNSGGGEGGYLNFDVPICDEQKLFDGIVNVRL